MAHRRYRYGLMGLAGATISYGLITLQLYLTIAILLPWLLPSVVIWMYALLTLKPFTKTL
ncbi:MAG: hypothetical protein KME16_00455 [Scytolyngbya sp. HA4215-MV1]|nr:hypothetical protein [Scytolyngbya sp. HA4215-MV1]